MDSSACSSELLLFCFVWFLMMPHRNYFFCMDFCRFFRIVFQWILVFCHRSCSFFLFLFCMVADVVTSELLSFLCTGSVVFRIAVLNGFGCFVRRKCLFLLLLCIDHDAFTSSFFLLVWTLVFFFALFVERILVFFRWNCCLFLHGF